MRERLEPVSKRQKSICKFCQQEIVWRKYASGGWYPADISYHPGLGEVVSAGAGNNFNLKRRHDCRGEAARFAEQVREKLSRLTDYTANIEQYEAALAHPECPENLKGFMQDGLATMKKMQAEYPATKAALEDQLARYEKLAAMK